MAEGNPNTVGEVNVGIGADLSGLKAGLAQAEQATKASADRMASSVSKAWGTMGGGGPGAPGGGGGGEKTPVGFGKSLKNLVAPLRGFRQGVQAVVGATLGWLGTIGLISGALATLGLALKAAADRLTGWGDAINAANANAAKLGTTWDTTISRIAGAKLDPPVDVAALKEASDLIEKLTVQIDAMEARIEELRSRPKFFGESQDQQSADLIRSEEAKLKKLKDREKQARELIDAAARRTQKHEEDELNRIDRKNQLLQKQERILRTIREQQKMDITGVTVAPGRFGAAFDLLQRQRTGGQ